MLGEPVNDLLGGATGLNSRDGKAPFRRLPSTPWARLGIIRLGRVSSGRGVPLDRGEIILSDG